MGSKKAAIADDRLVTKEAALEDINTSQSGLILHLQRFSTEDGPGIRTTVFFKG
jgi:hypothetical protein